jgi:membrane associated rhomboid family serine protease
MFIVPFPGDTPTKHTAWVVYGLMFANSCIFLVTCSPSAFGSVAQRFGFIPANHQAVTVLTSMFLHASLLHILGNMFFLWMFGERVENTLGHLPTFVAYLACGACGAWLYYLVNPDSTIPCVGASGAISGLVGMHLVLFPTAKMDLAFYLWRFPVGTVRTNAVVAVGVWLGEQSALGLIAAASGRSFGIAFMAHVGGLLAGASLGLAIIWSGISPGYRRMLAKRAAPFVRCPACGAEVPRSSPGHRMCWPCGTTFRVDEQGDVAVSDPSEPKAARWLVAAILVLVFAGLGKVYFDFWRHWR